MHFADVLNYIGRPDALSMKTQPYRAFSGAKTTAAPGADLVEQPGSPPDPAGEAAKNCKKVSAADLFFRYANAQ